MKHLAMSHCNILPIQLVPWYILEVYAMRYTLPIQLVTAVVVSKVKAIGFVQPSIP